VPFLKLLKNPCSEEIQIIFPFFQQKKLPGGGFTAIFVKNKQKLVYKKFEIIKKYVFPFPKCLKNKESLKTEICFFY
jgi:hypothetical protein